ncbi:MAG: peptidoglycan D,D-transpeptidase FtsI family protein [bacterium]
MSARRIELIAVIFMAMFLLEGGGLFYWQVIRSSDLNKRYILNEENAPVRGKIYDRFGRTLVINELKYSVFADPSLIKDPIDVGRKLNKILGNREDYKIRLSRDKRFVWIARKLDKKDAEDILAIDRNAFFIRQEYKRIYIDQEIPDILGGVDIDNNGLSGVELTMNDVLKEGKDVYLSIDSALQSKIEELLLRSKSSIGFKRGIVIVLSPHTGEILALVNLPHIKDFAVQDIFEPGSSLKPIVASIALEEDKVKMEDRFNCRPPFKISGVTIKDAPHSVSSYELNLKEIIEVSSNIGMAQVGLKIGTNLFYKYLYAFGFGHITGVELPNETPGLFPRDINLISLTQNSFGQGIGVSAIQLVSSYIPLANGGYLVGPTIIKRERIDSIKQVISTVTAKKITELLISVVKEGTGKKASIEGMEIAGKTGTAQKVINGCYSNEKGIMSFIGYLPALSPKYIIGVILDEPNSSRWASDTAAPLFKEIAKMLLYGEYIRGEG